FVFDPLLARAARALPSVTLRYRCELAAFHQDGAGVTVDLHDLATGAREQVRTQYLVGCDGFASPVRRALGIDMAGVPVLNRSINIMFRTRDLSAVHDKGNAGRYVIIGPEGPWASLTPADSERWRLMVHGGEDTDETPVDAAAEVRRAAGRDFDFEILGVGH